MPYVITDQTGAVQSVGSTVGTLPQGWTAHAISDLEFAGIRDGYLRWAAGVLEPTGAPTPAEKATILAARETNLAQLEAAIAALNNLCDGKVALDAATTRTTAVHANNGLTALARMLRYDLRLTYGVDATSTD